MFTRRQFLSLSPALPVISLSFILSCSNSNRGSLAVEARAVFPAGDPRPIAQVTIHLLDADLIRLAMAEGDEHSPSHDKVHAENPRLKSLAGLMNGRRREAYSLGPDAFLLLEQSRPLWEPHVLRTAETDAEGRASFENLRPGQYWLMCYRWKGGGEAFWNHQVIVEKGTNRVALDEINALYFK